MQPLRSLQRSLFGQEKGIMPQPPTVDPITRYLFENAWPGALLLLLAAIGCALAWRRSGQRWLAQAAVACAALAVMLFILVKFVVTSGERARSVTLALIEAAVAGDVAAARAQFSADASLSFADPQSPGESIDFIQESLEHLRGRYSIADN